MNYKTLLHIAFAIFLFAFLLWFSLIVKVFDYSWLYSILEFSFLSGYILFSFGLHQLNERMLIPSLGLIIFNFIGFVIYLLQYFDIYSLPIESNFGWTLYVFVVYVVPPLLFLILLKISNENTKIDNKLFMPIVLMGISVSARILQFISSEYFENEFFISDLGLRYIQVFTNPTSFILAISTFLWFDSSETLPVQSKKLIKDINEPMRIGDWLLTYLIIIIPIVNIAMLFIWAFNGNTNIHKSTWAKALLIWLAIIMVIYGVIFGIFIGSMF